jgi:hypothetical protein
MPATGARLNVRCCRQILKCSGKKVIFFFFFVFLMRNEQKSIPLLHKVVLHYKIIPSCNT